MDYKTINDYELIYLVNENNEDAFNIIFKKYENLINKYANYYYNNYKQKGINKDELNQEGKIGLYMALKTFDTLRNIKFYTLALSFIKKYMLNYIRMSLSHKNQIISGSVSLDNIDIKEKNNVALEIEEKELTKLLITFKNDLSFYEANIFELKYNGFKYDDIAKIMDMTKKQIDNKLLKIRKAFKNYLHVKGYELEAH